MKWQSPPAAAGGAGTDSGVIRVVSIMEAQFVTGPAKPLLDFAVRARVSTDDLPVIRQSVVTYHRDRAAAPSENPFVAAAEAAGIPVQIIYENKGRFDGTVIPQIAEIFENLKPDIVETHNVKSHFLMRSSGLAKKYPWIAYFHGYVTTDIKMRLYNQLDRWSLRSADRVVTVCEPFRRILESRGVDPSRITVNHNSIQPFEPVGEDAIEQVRRSLTCPAGTPLLIMVSRLSFEKGHLDLLEALALLKREGSAFHALVVGEGHERPALEAAIARLGLTNDVTLAGHQNDVRPYYSAATLYLMPSHSEGSPLALLEAMIAGVPVIASRAGGIPEMVTDGVSGLLTEPKNPASIAQAIGRLLKDPGLARRLAEAALADTARFSPEAYRRSLIGIYRQVLGAR